MDPNQQPNQNPLPPQQPPAPQPTGQPAMPAQPYQQPTPQQQPQQIYSQQPNYQQPAATPPPTPQTPSSYSTQPQTSYNPDYLDTIAPAAPPPKFFSGSFGKIFFGMLILFFIAVSIIIAFSGKDETADLQQTFVRIEHLSKTTKTVQPNLKSSKLSNTNSNFQIWLTGNKSAAEELLKLGGISRTDYSKEMVAEEETLAVDLDAKLEDARLNARLDRIYAGSMAAETEKMMIILNTMGRKNKSEKIRDFAKTASTNLEPIHKSFDEYTDDGN
jgi:hypothetical protein